MVNSCCHFQPGGPIEFAISAAVSRELSAALHAVPDQEWITIKTERDGTLRQWAEVEFTPYLRYEQKNAQPLRYMGIRLLKAQGSLFADGSDRMHFAVVTNLDWEGKRLVEWHREKAGTIEHVHDELKNGLAAAHMPSRHFAVNATWLKLSIMAYNVAAAIKGLCFSPEERTARMKRYPLLIVHVAGRMNRNNCVLGLRLCADPSTIARLQSVWNVFTLPTQATSAKPLPRAG